VINEFRSAQQGSRDISASTVSPQQIENQSIDLIGEGNDLA